MSAHVRALMVLLGITLLAGPAAAKIRVADSVEWWCAQSSSVVSGTLVEVDGPVAARGKSRDLVSLKLRVAPTKKGEPATHEYFSMRLQDATQLKTWMKNKTEVLVFLRTTAQGYTKNGISYDQWPVRQTNRGQLVVDPSDPKTELLVARTMTRIKTAADAKQVCRQVKQAQPKSKDGRPLKFHLLQTPYESEVGRILYSGSATYLRVPPFGFPKARADF